MRLQERSETRCLQCIARHGGSTGNSLEDIGEHVGSGHAELARARANENIHTRLLIWSDGVVKRRRCKENPGSIADKPIEGERGGGDTERNPKILEQYMGTGAESVTHRCMRRTGRRGD